MVGFNADYSNNESGWAGITQIFGPSQPSDMNAGVLFTYNFQNKTTGSSFNYDLSSLLACLNPHLVSGNSTGTVAPGETAQVSILNYSAGGNGDDQDADCYLWQIAAAPLVTTASGETICFWFYTDGKISAWQQIEICNNSQSSFPITSTPTNTSSQMNCENSSMGLGIGIGGGGGGLTTNNIWIQVYDVT
jgi:hypothetical protein